MATSRSFRFLRGATLGVLVLAATAGPARAQGVLGRVRDRARQAASGAPNRTEAPATCAAGDRDRAAQADIGEDMVTRYARALRANDQEVRRIAAQNTPEGRYYAKVLLRDSLAKRHATFRRHVGPDWQRYQAIHNRPPSADYNVNMRNAQEAAQVEESINESSVQVPDLEWAAQKRATDTLEVIARGAGGIGLCEWAAIVEIIPQVVAAVCTDRREGNPERGATEIIVGRSSGLRPGELRVISAHAFELARGLNVDCPSDEELAVLRREKAQQDSLRTAQSAWTACRQRVLGPGGGAPTAATPAAQESVTVWQRQLADAQKRGDQNAVVAIGMKIGAAMMPGMMQQSQAQMRAQQECGAAPGTPRR